MKGRQVRRSASRPGCLASTTSSWRWRKARRAGALQHCPACIPTSCCACSPPSLPALTSPSAAGSPQPLLQVRLLLIGPAGATGFHAGRPFKMELCIVLPYQCFWTPCHQASAFRLLLMTAGATFTVAASHAWRTCEDGAVHSAASAMLLDLIATWKEGSGESHKPLEAMKV